MKLYEKSQTNFNSLPSGRFCAKMTTSLQRAYSNHEASGRLPVLFSIFVLAAFLQNQLAQNKFSQYLHAVFFAA